MSKGSWVVEWFEGDELYTTFFHYERDALKFKDDLYFNYLISADVFRDDYKVYADLADQAGFVL